MKEWTWPTVTIFGIIVAAIVIMFLSTDDSALQSRLVGYLDALVPFVVGAGAGAAVGGSVGYVRGKGI